VKTLLKDPLFVLSLILAALGGIQASVGYLSPLVEQHPLGFGLAMTTISVFTATLTAARAGLMKGGEA